MRPAPDAFCLLSNGFYPMSHSQTSSRNGAPPSYEPPLPFGVMDSPTLATSEFVEDYLVDGLIVKNQPTLLAGSPKSCKTLTAIDLAVSLGTGTPVFGTFAVEKPTHTLFLSAESGQATIKRHASTIAEQRGTSLSALDVVYWGFQTPRLTCVDDRDDLERIIEEQTISVLIVDPLYLSLGGAVNHSNVFEMGDVLATLGYICQRHDCTLVLVHHLKKSTPDRERYGPPDLTDMSFSGTSEFARQWILLNRRQRYVEGSGNHALWMSAGGSAGHGGLWALDIDEGTPDARKWDVTVSEGHELREAREEQSKAKRQEERRTERGARLLTAMAGCPAAQKGADGETIRQLASLCSPTMKRDLAEEAMEVLVAGGQVQTTQITKGGNGCTGYRLA